MKITPFHFYYYLCPNRSSRGDCEYFIVPCFTIRVRKTTARICFLTNKGLIAKDVGLAMIKDSYDGNDKTISEFLGRSTESIKDYEKFFVKGCEDRVYHQPKCAFSYMSPAKEMYLLGYCGVETETQK